VVVVISYFHTADGKRRLQMSEAQQRGFGTAGHKLCIIKKENKIVVFIKVI
jgi:hypothetical protein